MECPHCGKSSDGKEYHGKQSGTKLEEMTEQADTQAKGDALESIIQAFSGSPAFGGLSAEPTVIEIEISGPEKEKRK